MRFFCAQVTGRIHIHLEADGSAPAAQNFAADDVLSAAQIIDVERASLPAHVLYPAYLPCNSPRTFRALQRLALMMYARGYYLYRSGGGLSCLVVCVSIGAPHRLLQLAQRLPALVRTSAAVRAEAVDFVNEWRQLSVHSQVGVEA